MLHFITGRPGTSKSLNCFKTVCTDRKYAGRPKFYKNITLNRLDYQQCQTFQGFFYDSDLPSLLPIDAPQPQNRAHYLEQRKPRIPGLNQTAPVYDHLTQPHSFPKPQNCVLWREGTPQEVCICYSQRITRMEVPTTCAKPLFAMVISMKPSLTNDTTETVANHPAERFNPMNRNPDLSRCAAAQRSAARTGRRSCSTS